MKHFDEREAQERNESGRIAFEAVFAGLLIAIVVQLVLSQGNLRCVLGETVVLLAGGIVYLTLSLRKGIWTKDKPSVKNNSILSICISIIFSAILAVICREKAPEAMLWGQRFWLVWSICCFFLFTALEMLVLTLLARAAEKRKQAMEKKYEE